jgi:hypothetical protein
MDAMSAASEMRSFSGHQISELMPVLKAALEQAPSSAGSLVQR